MIIREVSRHRGRVLGAGALHTMRSCEEILRILSYHQEGSAVASDPKPLKHQP